MTKQKSNNIIIPLDEKSEAVLLEIIKKNNLEENDEQAFEKIKAHKPLNETVVIKLTRDLIVGRISAKEFAESLHRKLNISIEKTKMIAKDIINNLIPLLEKIPEDRLEDYNRKKKLSEVQEEIEEKQKLPSKSSTQDIILEKIRQSAPVQIVEEQKPAIGVKKVKIKDVEENAERIKKEKKWGREKTGEEVKKSAENIEKKEESDDYREAIE